MSDEYLASTRRGVCDELNSDAGHDGVAAIIRYASEVVAEESGALQPIVRSGDEFTDFLRQEDQILESYGLGEAARELALRLALAHRRWTATSNTETIRAAVARTLDPSRLQQGVTLLCAPDHSPANNVSHASWLSWTWAATKFVGGLAIVGINASSLFASAGLSASFAAISGVLGAQALGSGINDLGTLLPGGQER